MRYTTIRSNVTILLYHFHTQIEDIKATSMKKTDSRIKVQLSCKDVPEELQKKIDLAVLYVSVADFCSSISGVLKLH